MPAEASDDGAFPTWRASPCRRHWRLRPRSHSALHPRQARRRRAHLRRISKTRGIGLRSLRRRARVALSRSVRPARGVARLLRPSRRHARHRDLRTLAREKRGGTMSLKHVHDDRSAELLERAFRELLIEKGLVSDAAVDERVEFMYARTPALGARVVARAWFDSGFKARLLADGSAAVRELGIDVGALNLVVVENAPQLHNLIVCTLCSCYPRMLLGLPPDWYKSVEYPCRAGCGPRAGLVGVC